MDPNVEMQLIQQHIQGYSQFFQNVSAMFLKPRRHQRVIILYVNKANKDWHPLHPQIQFTIPQDHIAAPSAHQPVYTSFWKGGSPWLSTSLDWLHYSKRSVKPTNQDWQHGSWDHPPAIKAKIMWAALFDQCTKHRQILQGCANRGKSRETSKASKQEKITDCEGKCQNGNLVVIRRQNVWGGPTSPNNLDYLCWRICCLWAM